MAGVLQHCPRCGSEWVRLVYDLDLRCVACTRCNGIEITRPHVQDNVEKIDVSQR